MNITDGGLVITAADAAAIHASKPGFERTRVLAVLEILRGASLGLTWVTIASSSHDAPAIVEHFRRNGFAVARVKTDPTLFVYDIRWGKEPRRDP